MNKENTVPLSYFLNKKIALSLIFPIILSAIATILAIKIPLSLTKVINNMLDGYSFNLSLISYILFLGLIQLLLEIWSNYRLKKIGSTAVYEVRLQVISKILSLKNSFFDKNMSGNISSILSNDSNSIATLVGSTIPKLVISIIEVCMFSFTLLLLSVKLTIVVVIIIPTILIIYYPLGRYITKFFSQIQETIGKVNSFGFFITKSQKYIKINNTKQVEKNNGKQLLTSLKNVELQQAKFTSFVSPFLSILSIGSVLLVILFGFYLVSINQFTTGSLVAYLSIFFQIITPVGAIGNSLHELQGIKGTTVRLNSLLKNNETENLQLGDSLEEVTSLEFKNVNFSYPNSFAKKETNVFLKNINFTAKKNEIIAIVGPSGSGKTTIFDLVERFYDIDSGSILLNKLDINTYSIQSLRSNIEYVSQNYPLISGDIQENLIYGVNTDYSENELLTISNKTTFKNVILKLPNGLKTYIGEDGTLLSGGEKQRLAITRAFLKLPSILLLDEITSALDAMTESVIEENIQYLKKDRLVFIIAHRLSTIQNADKIIFMENGSITGIGTHSELLENHSLYKEFIKIQFKNS